MTGIETRTLGEPDNLGKTAHSGITIDLTMADIGATNLGVSFLGSL